MLDKILDHWEALRRYPQANTQRANMDTPSNIPPNSGQERDLSSANYVVKQYCLQHSEEYRRLDVLRQMGWNSAEGDLFFVKQRQAADKPNSRTTKNFFQLMKRIGDELHRATDVFALPGIDTGPVSVLDMCMAPGGFLGSALRRNPDAVVKAFTLPTSQGGHKVLLPTRPKVVPMFLDITMLAADMGVGDIPPDHPDAGNFLPKKFQPDDAFDLAICDGQVLRTHPRATYREGKGRESSRLINAQLALSLEHLRPGGTMVVLLHRLDSYRVMDLVWRFSQFSTVRLLKPSSGHTKRSSFYLVAKEVQSKHPDASASVAEWKARWKSATFDTDEKYHEVVHDDAAHAKKVLEDLGPSLMEMGREIWKIQADALEKAPFIRNTHLTMS